MSGEPNQIQAEGETPQLDVWDVIAELRETNQLSSIRVARWNATQNEYQHLHTDRDGMIADPDDLQTSFGPGTYSLQVQKKGHRGCYFRDQGIRIGQPVPVGGRSMGNAGASGQPAATHPHASAAGTGRPYYRPEPEPTLDLEQIVAQAVAKALGPVLAARQEPAAPQQRLYTADEIEKRLQEERERAKQDAREAAEKAELRAEMESLRRQVQEAKSAPSAALASNPDFLGSLITKITTLAESKTTSQTTQTDPFAQVTKLMELAPKLVGTPANQAAEITKAISDAIAPALAGMAGMQAEERKARLDIEREKVKEESRHKEWQRQFALERDRERRLQLFGDPEKGIPPTPAAIPAPTPTPSAQDEMATIPAPTLFIRTLLDAAQADDPDPVATAARIAMDHHGMEALDAIGDLVDPYLESDLADPEVQENLLQLVLRHLPLLKRATAKPLLKNASVRNSTLKQIHSVLDWVRGLGESDPAALKRVGLAPADSPSPTPEAT